MLAQWLERATEDREVTGSNPIGTVLLNFGKFVYPVDIACVYRMRFYTVFCPGFQKGRVPSEKGIFSAVS